jgi:hypothetical protein
VQPLTFTPARRRLERLQAAFLAGTPVPAPSST